MKTTEQIQSDYAKGLKHETFEDLLLADVTEIDWHVSNVQKLYANELTNKQSIRSKIISIQRETDGMIFSLGDTVKFSDRFNSFILDEIRFNANERRVELAGDGLFCSLIESDCKIITHN